MRSRSARRSHNEWHLEFTQVICWDWDGKTEAFLALMEGTRSEIGTHILAYNLIRTIMAQAAAAHDLLPRTISFKGASQTLEAFQPAIELQATRGTVHRQRLYRDLLDAIATHRVADRPDRFEPRLKKHRRNHYGWLTRPRADVKRELAKGVAKI